MGGEEVVALRLVELGRAYESLSRLWGSGAPLRVVLFRGGGGTVNGGAQGIGIVLAIVETSLPF